MTVADNRLAEIDDAAAASKLRRRYRDAERQRVCADQAAVAVGPPAPQAADQTKAAQQADGAIGKTDQQSAYYHNVAAGQLRGFLAFCGSTAGRYIGQDFRAAITFQAACQSTARQHKERNSRAA